jgi:peptidoglycan/xylan/chitin deacetylase (PgdA/CDA1 family)
MRAVLTYHSIDDSDSPISVRPSVFAEHVRWLASGRVRVVALRELHACEGDAVAITFDDGFENFEREAFPHLAAHGLPATVFVVSGFAGRSNAWDGRGDAGVPVLPLLSWNALNRLAAAGVEIGAHTRRHVRLDRLGDAALDDEIGGGADDIARQLGRRPTAFAYPYGAVSRAAAACVRNHFAVGVTTQLRVLRAREDVALLPRVDCYYLRDPGLLEGWDTPRFRARLRVRRAARCFRRLSFRDVRGPPPQRPTLTVGPYQT